ncbi:hypothetical protein AAVH_28136, partial [Aphelenchoides avenae]
GNVVQGQSSYFGWVFAVFTFISAFFHVLFAPFLGMISSPTTSTTSRPGGSGGGRGSGGGGPDAPGGGGGGGGGRRPMGRLNSRSMDMSSCPTGGCGR